MVIGIPNVPNYRNRHEDDVGEEAHPPDDFLPRPFPQVPQHIYPDQETGDGPSQMSHVSNLP